MDDLYDHELEPFPDKSKYIIKPKFEERYRLLLGDNYQKFMDYSLSFKRRGIRVNTLKVSIEEIKKRLEKDWILTPVPWYSDAFWIEHRGVGDAHRRDVGNLLEHALGYIYIQDPASSIPPLVLSPTAQDIVLDMCAAPGSKTTQMSQLMKNKGVIVANELVGARIAALGINIQRMGAANIVVTQHDANRLPKQKFTKILLDAPCSGMGTIRKSPKTLNMWNPAGIKKLVGIQRRLIKKAYDLLEVGGEMVYSTCSTEPEENEGVVSWFLENCPNVKVLPITIALNRSKPIESFEGVVYDSRVKDTLRIWPFDNDTEGFYVARFQKTA